jgi:hypothetical protein
MDRLDLEDLPPKIAAQLRGLAHGETLLLVEHGAVVGRLTAGAATGATEAQADPEPPPDQHAREVFENFRSAIEDEF